MEIWVVLYANSELHLRVLRYIWIMYFSILYCIPVGFIILQVLAARVLSLTLSKTGFFEMYAIFFFSPYGIFRELEINLCDKEIYLRD